MERQREGTKKEVQEEEEEEDGEHLKLGGSSFPAQPSRYKHTHTHTVFWLRLTPTNTHTLRFTCVLIHAYASTHLHTNINAHNASRSAFSSKYIRAHTLAYTYKSHTLTSPHIPDTKTVSARTDNDGVRC